MTWTELLLAPATRAALESLWRDPPHAMLLLGPEGTGKRTLAETWASALNSDKGADIRVIQPDEKGTIGIETIRSLYAATRARHQGQRVVIIDQAQAMGTEAQNALLKLLEEPLPGNVLMLTASSATQVLPTILSRVQVVQVQPLARETLAAYAQKHGVTDPQLVAQFLFIVGGRVGELSRLVQDAAYAKKQLEQAATAKRLLSQPPFERLLMMGELAKDRQVCLRTLEIMQRMLRAGLGASSSPEASVGLLGGVARAEERIAANGNVRAQLTALFTSY